MNGNSVDHLLFWVIMPRLKSYIFHPMEHEPGSVLRGEGVQIFAKTVGEVLAEAGRILSVKFELHEGPMWYRAYGVPDCGSRYLLADLSVERSGVLLYPMRPHRDPDLIIEDCDTVSVFVITD